MSKGQNTRKNSKKAPARTMKEKKAAKRQKKNEKRSFGDSINKQLPYFSVNIFMPAFYQKPAKKMQSSFQPFDRLNIYPE